MNETHLSNSVFGHLKLTICAISPFRHFVFQRRPIKTLQICRTRLREPSYRQHGVTLLGLDRTRQVRSKLQFWFAANVLCYTSCKLFTWGKVVPWVHWVCSTFTSKKGTASLPGSYASRPTELRVARGPGNKVGLCFKRWVWIHTYIHTYIFILLANLKIKHWTCPRIA